MPATSLGVWMNGDRVGTWTRAATGTHSFQYAPGWPASAAGRVLSLSLPFTPGNAPHRGTVVAAYFENLLPDSDEIRRRLREKYRTDSGDAFDLLTAIGRDCVGAVQLLPDGHQPEGWNRIEGTPLTDAEVEQVIDATLGGGRVLGLAEDDDFRLSLAGAQEKTALLRHNGRWCLPQRATPTTHIFKLPLGLVGNLQADLKDSVEIEWLCLALLRELGLPAARAEIIRFGHRKVLAVERFDRQLRDGWIARLPQEDLCQALGYPPVKKYEADGGPGMAAILPVLRGGTQAAGNQRVFVQGQLIFWLLAATDGHAKNFSLFHERGGGYRMTPLYDVLSAWPIIGPGPRQLAWQKAQLAMALRGKSPHRKLGEIRRRHWQQLFGSAGITDPDQAIAQLLEAVPPAIQRVSRQLPPEFPGPIADVIFTGVTRQAETLRQDR